MRGGPQVLAVPCLRSPAGGWSLRRRGFSRPRPKDTVVATHRRREVLTAYLLLAPALLLIPGVLLYPVAWEVWSSLTDRSVQHLSTAYVGLSNYLHFLNDPAFWAGTGYTLGYIAITAVLKLAVGVLVALALSRPFRGRPVVFLAVFLPWAYPASVALIGWYRFLVPPVHTAYSGLTANLGLFFDSWLGSGTWGFLSLVAFNVWRGGSFTGIFLLAALNAIPSDLFDFAALDVKDRWRKFWMVTVPLLRPFLALAVFLSLTTAVADLGDVWLQTGRRDVYPIIWTQALHYAIIGGQWGKASALSLILLPALAVILLGCYRLFEPLEDDQT
jgi:multiple sugar transport system permease protein